MKPIRVLVTKRPDSPFFLLYYKDPATGKRRAKSSGETIRRKADALAEKWERELNDGLREGSASWATFSNRFNNEYLLGRPANTVRSYRNAIRAFEKRMGDTRRLGDIDASVMSEFVGKLRGEGKPGSTIRSLLTHIKRSFSWAVGIGILQKVPVMTMPKLDQSSLAKGRAISDEEFVRFKQGLEQFITAERGNADDVAKWLRMADGLWLSGLRLSEALIFSWDSPPVQIDLDTYDFPRLTIHSEGQKSRRDQVLPITPDFAEFLRRTPRDSRTGLVFPVTVGKRRKIKITYASKIFSGAGEKAGIVVATGGKFASAHDLRRSFGTRWATRVQPALLQLLMRHRHISTTMSYYVGINSDAASAQLWTVNPSVNSSIPLPKKQKRKA